LNHGFESRINYDKKHNTARNKKNASLRLNKALATAGICSRRAADELIAAGKVMVNNLPANPGQQVIPGIDQITLNGAPVLFERKK
jgi:ribosomal large subunit pseudouridine synthase B (EC 5.4.99.-)